MQIKEEVPGLRGSAIYNDLHSEYIKKGLQQMLNNVGNQKLEPPVSFYSKNVLDNFNIYDFFQKTPAPGLGFRKFTKLSFTKYLPIYVEDQKKAALEQFTIWLTEQNPGEVHSTLIFRPPGVGKTTIARWASVVAGTVYVRFPGNKTIMKSLKAEMQKIILQENQDLNVNTLMKKLSIVSLQAIVQMCELTFIQINSSTGLDKYCIEECPGNHFRCNIKKTLSEEEIQQMLVDSLQHATVAFQNLYLFCNRTVVIHLDEMQDWELNMDVNNFTRKYDGFIKPTEAQNYFILAFSEALQEAVSGINIRFVFSGVHQITYIISPGLTN